MEGGIHPGQEQRPDLGEQMANHSDTPQKHSRKDRAYPGGTNYITEK